MLLLEIFSSRILLFYCQRPSSSCADIKKKEGITNCKRNGKLAKSTRQSKDRKKGKG